MKRFCAVLVMVLVGCGDGDSRPAEVYDASRTRRVFEPPAGEVRAVPPHAIHSKGIGPYLLGANLKSILELLPMGPRVALMEIEGLLDYSLVKAEDDTLLIGVRRPGGVTFVAALDQEVARTEGGVGVGASLTELRESLGAPVPMAREPRDPRILVFDGLPNTRFVIDDDRVIAVLVSGDASQPVQTAVTDAGAAAPAAAAAGCQARARLEPVHDQVVAAALGSGEVGGELRVTYGCITGSAGAEALVAAGDRLVVVGGEPGTLRRVTTHSLEGLEFAVPVELEGDRHGIAAVTRSREGGTYQVTVEVFRLEGGRLNRIAREDVYRLTANAAAWIGARLEDVDLLIELSPNPDGITVGGLYLHRGQGAVRTVAPLMPHIIGVRQRRPAPAPDRDAGVARAGRRDAGSGGDAGAGDAGPRSRP